MTTRRFAAIAGTALLTLGLAACGSDTETTVTETVTATPTTTEQTQPLPEEVTRITDALDSLEADHTTPEESDPGELSGADRSFDLDIVDYSAGINLFTTEDDLNTWQEASDDFGGISVTFDTTAVSLNSDEGRDASLALAPQLAEELGGVAHTGGEEPDYTPSGADTTASERDSIWAPAGQGHRCPRTDAYVWDVANCTPENLGAMTNYAQEEDAATREYWERQEREEAAYRAEVDAHNAEVDAYEQRVEEYDAAWMVCMGDDIDRPDYYEQLNYCRDTIPEP